MMLESHIPDGSDCLERSILGIQQDMTSTLFMSTTTLPAQSIGRSSGCEFASHPRLFAEDPLFQYQQEQQLNILRPIHRPGRLQASTAFSGTSHPDDQLQILPFKRLPAVEDMLDVFKLEPG